MPSLAKILENVTNLKARNQRIFRPLLDLTDAEIMPYDVSESGLTRGDIRDKLKKIESCSGLLEFRTEFVADSSGVLEQKFKIHNATYCRHYTVCEICSRRVQHTRWKKFKEPIDKMVERFPYVYHVTFTIEDKNGLSERIDFLQNAFRNFVRMGQGRKGKKSNGEWSKVGAAIVATESKRGDNSELWHSHKHALLFCSERLDYQVYDRDKVRKLEKKYGFRRVPKEEMIGAALNVVTRENPFTKKTETIPLSKLSGEWYAATEGQGFSVHVRAVTGKHVADKAKEVLKYPVKVNLKNSSDIPYIIEQTYNRRFISTYGALRGLQEDKYELDETKDSTDIYLSQWTGFKYSDLVSGSPIAFLTDEVKKTIFSRMAKLTGTYRTQRKNAVVEYERQKIKILPELAERLNFIKAQYRAGIAKINAHFAKMPQLAGRIMPRWSRSPLPDAEQLSLAF
jgi:hypothetical protein